MADEQSNTEKFEELCAGYVLEDLDEDERAEFEQMLEGASEEELTFYREMEAAANQMALPDEGSQSSNAAREQLIAQVRSRTNIDQQEKSTLPTADKGAEVIEDDSFNWSAFTAAASFALLIISLSLIFYALNLNSEIANRGDVIDRQEVEITELKSELEQKEEMLSILEAREVNIVLMSGMEANPDGFGKIIWNPETRQALLQVSNLPTAPEGKEYQLWLIKNNKPVSAGLFSVRDQGDTFFKIDDIASSDEQSANTFVVTMEPEGGMPRPTGDTYLMGSMGEE